MAVLVMDRKTQAIRQEFAEKSNVLLDYGTWLSPWDFYSLLFGQLGANDKVMVIEAGNKYMAMPLESAIDFSMGRSDIYISPAIYFQNRYKSSFLDRIFAIAVDVDNVGAKMLHVIMQNIQRGELARPTAVTNSGSGIHFYYIFTNPLIAYRNVRAAAYSLYDSLHSHFGEGINLTQKHWIGQPYRVVGGLTKAGDVSQAFRIGEFWTPETLAIACKSTWQVSQLDRAAGATEKMQKYASLLAELQELPKPDFTNFDETYDFINANQKVIFSARVTNKAVTPPQSSQKWYEDTRRRIVHETREGKRYSSLMALCVIAYKCQITREAVERDIYMIADLWSREKWLTPFNRSNIKAALRCHSPNFIKVRRATLEEWLGWTFPGTCKRNGRTQTEHLEKIAVEKRAHSMYHIERYLKDNPVASRKRVALDLGMSRNTVAKYYDWVKKPTKK